MDFSLVLGGDFPLLVVDVPQALYFNENNWASERDTVGRSVYTYFLGGAK
jgi:hypothetical protein